MNWERIVVHCQHPTWMRETGIHSHNLIFPCGSNFMPRSPRHWAVLPWRMVHTGNLKLFLLPSSMYPVSGVFLLQLCAGILSQKSWTSKMSLSFKGDCQYWLLWGGKTVENPSFDIFLMTLQTKKFKEEQKRKYKNDGGKKEYNEIIDLKSWD